MNDEELLEFLCCAWCQYVVKLHKGGTNDPDFGFSVQREEGNWTFYPTPLSLVEKFWRQQMQDFDYATRIKNMVEARRKRLEDGKYVESILR